MLVPRTVATLSHTHGLSACYPSHLVMSSHHGDSDCIALSLLPVCFALTPALRGFVITSSPSPRPCMLPHRTVTSLSPTHWFSACYSSHLALPSHHGDSSCIALSSLHVSFTDSSPSRLHFRVYPLTTGLYARLSYLHVCSPF